MIQDILTALLILVALALIFRPLILKKWGRCKGDKTQDTACKDCTLAQFCSQKNDQKDQPKIKPKA